LLPNTSLTLWSYTDLSDPRWTLGREFILLEQQTGDVLPQKIGAWVPAGWLAYVLDGVAFVKRFDVTVDGRYPDMGSNAELFTNRHFLEVESLGQLVTLPPAATVTHREVWSLHADVPTPQHDDDVKAHILPLIPTD
jgi:hypothetical protein